MRMKVGDLVIKEGDLDMGKTGIVIEVQTNDLGNTIVTVSTPEGEKNWYYELVKVVEGSCTSAPTRIIINN